MRESSDIHETNDSKDLQNSRKATFGTDKQNLQILRDMMMRHLGGYHTPEAEIRSLGLGTKPEAVSRDRSHEDTSQRTINLEDLKTAPKPHTLTAFYRNVTRRSPEKSAVRVSNITREIIKRGQKVLQQISNPNIVSSLPASNRNDTEYIISLVNGALEQQEFALKAEDGGSKEDNPERRRHAREELQRIANEFKRIQKQNEAVDVYERRYVPHVESADEWFLFHKGAWRDDLPKNSTENYVRVHLSVMTANGYTTGCYEHIVNLQEGVIIGHYSSRRLDREEGPKDSEPLHLSQIGWLSCREAAKDRKFDMSQFNPRQLISLSVQEDTTEAVLEKHYTEMKKSKKEIQNPDIVQEADSLYTDIMEKSKVGKSKKNLLADHAPHKKVSRIKISRNPQGGTSEYIKFYIAEVVS